MPRYEYLCPECGYEDSIIKSMKDVDKPFYCSFCDTTMTRNFQAENVVVGAGRRSYHKPIYCESMAVSPTQVEEHRRLFPDIKISNEGVPVFDNFSDHEKYLKKRNIEKVPQKIRKRGKRIS